MLSLIASTRAILTRTTTATDPNNPTGPQLVTSYPCDLQGNAVPLGQGLPIYADALSGKTYVRVAEVIPSGTASADVAAAAAIRALDPIHYTNDDGSVRGYFVLAPDFNNREPKVATVLNPAPAAVPPRAVPVIPPPAV